MLLNILQIYLPTVSNWIYESVTGSVTLFGIWFTAWFPGWYRQKPEL